LAVRAVATEIHHLCSGGVLEGTADWAVKSLPCFKTTIATRADYQDLDFAMSI
jgi:hypothetical protein